MKEKSIFKNFQEFNYLTRELNSFQRDVLFNSIPLNEQNQLSKSFKNDGWEDLFLINEVDVLVDKIKEEFGVDLVLLRIQTLSGSVQKVSKSFWDYVNNIFKKFSYKHTWNVFEGIKVLELNKDYILLVPSKRRENGKEGK